MFEEQRERKREREEEFLSRRGSAREGGKGREEKGVVRIRSYPGLHYTRRVRVYERYYPQPPGDTKESINLHGIIAMSSGSPSSVSTKSPGRRLKSAYSRTLSSLTSVTSFCNDNKSNSILATWLWKVRIIATHVSSFLEDPYDRARAKES